MSQQGSLSAGGISPGNTAQWLQTSTGAFATITTVINPTGDAIPQQTDGTELLTLTITPTKATNRLFLTFNCITASVEGGGTCIPSVALFQDATANALAAGFLIASVVISAASRSTNTLTYSMIAGTTEATTFKIRCGVLAVTETLYINGATTRQYGGVSSTTFTIVEVEV